MPASKRFVDELVEAFDLNQRRKFVLTLPSGATRNLYFKPITRADRKKAQQLAGTDEALDLSTNMLCLLAELEDGTKPFAPADAAKLQRKLPESGPERVLSCPCPGLSDPADMDETKTTEAGQADLS